jgi:hypothetical protein
MYCWRKDENKIFRKVERTKFRKDLAYLVFLIREKRNLDYHKNKCRDYFLHDIFLKNIEYYKNQDFSDNFN